MMLRDYIDEGDFIICPQAELRVSLRVIRGLLRAGFTVAGLLEIHSEVLRHKTNGLTVSIDTLPQLGVRMMQMMHCEKTMVSRAAELLHCGAHSFVREGYDSYYMSHMKPGIHAAARMNWASSGAGAALERLLSDALVPHFAKIQRIERSCASSPPDDSSAAQGGPGNSFAAAGGGAVAAAATAATSEASSTEEAAAKQHSMLVIEQELKAARESSERARAEAESWRISATRWRGISAVVVATVVVALAIFGRRLPRRLQL
jgi:hypothetical protein